jgi:exodeoxyribonuclease VII large subunit
MLGYTVYPAMEPRHVFTVSELNTTARAALEEGVGKVWVQGEVSDLTRAPSGHLYFTLKDETSQLSSVRFKSRTSLLAPVTIEPGTVVLAHGTLTVYEPRGRYQFIVSIMQPLGTGSLQRAFEQLKKKLKEEGLFSSESKSELPSIPRSIGLITSSKGAALRDVHSVLQRRWPHVRLFLFPSTVQGDAAPKELREALDRAIRFSQSSHALDVLVLTRGGGSAEDLAAFNDEALARDLYACPIPIISAVGHEIDFSISDFVADLRAPTPSAAAEVAVPDRIETLGVVTARLHRILRQTRAVWKGRADEFRLRAETCLLRSPQRRFETYEQRLDLGLEAILRNMTSRWKAKQDASLHWAEILRLSDPSLPLHRGYSLTVRQGDTRPIRSIADLKVGDPIETQLADGLLLSHIKEVSPHES